MRRLLVLGTIAASLVGVLPAHASYRAGWDPDDMVGPFDIRMTSVRLFEDPQGGKGVVVRVHFFPDAVGRSVTDAEWWLDSWGGPHADFRVSALYEPGSNTGCSVRSLRTGRVWSSIHVLHGTDTIACVFPRRTIRWVGPMRWRAVGYGYPSTGGLTGRDRAPDVGKYG